MCIGVGNHAGCSDGPNTKRTNSLGQVRTSSRRSSQPKNPAFGGGPDRESAIRVLAGIAGLRDTLEDRPLTSCCRWGDDSSHPPRHRGRGSGPARPVRACVPFEDCRHGIGLRARARRARAGRHRRPRCRPLVTATGRGVRRGRRPAPTEAARSSTLRRIWRPCGRPMPTAVRQRCCSRRYRPSANGKARPSLRPTCSRPSGPGQGGTGSRAPAGSPAS